MPKSPKNKRRFLLLVDLQKTFRPPKALLKRVSQALPHYETVFFTQFFIKKGSLFDQKGFQKGRPGASETALALRPPKSARVLKKYTYGLAPEHIRVLKKAGVKHIDVGGVDTDACVLACLFSLWDNEISFTVRGDLSHSTRKLGKLARILIKENFFPAKH